LGYSVYLQRFLHGEPSGVSHHGIKGVAGAPRRDGDRWSLERPDWAETITFTSHPESDVSAIAISRPTDAIGLRVFIFEMLQLGFVLFTQDLDRIWASDDRRSHLPTDLQGVPFVIVASAQEVWREGG
jgi:hypothetical protein